MVAGKSVAATIVIIVVMVFALVSVVPVTMPLVVLLVVPVIIPLITCLSANVAVPPDVTNKFRRQRRESHFRVFKEFSSE